MTKPSTTTQETRELEPCPFCPDGAVQTCFREAKIGAHSDEVVFHWVECDCGARGPEDRDKAEAERLWNTRALTDEVTRLREALELEPHKKINLLTVLEHQVHRNHEYHPDQCAECSLTQTIAERMRDELGLTTRAALQPKAEEEQK